MALDMHMVMHPDYPRSRLYFVSSLLHFLILVEHRLKKLVKFWVSDHYIANVRNGLEIAMVM